MNVIHSSKKESFSLNNEVIMPIGTPICGSFDVDYDTLRTTPCKRPGLRAVMLTSSWYEFRCSKHIFNTVLLMPIEESSKIIQNLRVEAREAARQARMDAQNAKIHDSERLIARVLELVNG